VETAEERRIKKVKDIMNEKDEVVSGEEYEECTFVHVPHDLSLPMREVKMKVVKKKDRSEDALVDYLKPFFSAISDNVDFSLLKDNATRQLGLSSSAPTNVSEDALKAVANQGQVEVFCLVHATPSNKFKAINIYLDEIGMLKRLPLNKRASEYAFLAGYNPRPNFYGDIFIGRLVVSSAEFKIYKRLCTLLCMVPKLVFFYICL